jgi:type VI secretion system protein ImpM
MPSEFVNTLGYYGKVPTLGDFVGSRLPRSFVDSWDLWLQEAIAASRRQLGEDWLNFYLTSPLYHFALSPGICGDSGWMGVLMPSVDKIGRYYPMTMGLMLNEDINPFIAMQKSEWFAKIEEIALSCLKDDYNLEEFNRSIDQLNREIGMIPTDSLCLTERMSHDEFTAAWRQPLDDTESMTSFLPVLLDNLIKDRCLAYSLWWTAGSDLISSSFLFSQGLPPIDSVAAMFDGKWQKWGWKENIIGSRFYQTRSPPQL